MEPQWGLVLNKLAEYPWRLKKVGVSEREEINCD